MSPADDVKEALDSVDYVVVLMLVNRSFDSLLGYLYPNGVPAGKTFEGGVGKALANPDPRHRNSRDLGHRLHRGPLNDLQRSMAGSAAALHSLPPPLSRHGEAITFLRGLPGLPGKNPRPDHNPCG